MNVMNKDMRDFIGMLNRIQAHHDAYYIEEKNINV